VATVFRRVTNFNWTAAVLSPLAVILMEALWVYPWLAWTRELPGLNWQQTPLSLGSLIVLIGIPFCATRFLPGQRWALRLFKLIIVLATIFTVVRIEYGAGFAPLSGQWFVHIARILLDSFSFLHPIILALIASVYLCWRGIRLGHSQLYFNDVYPPFMVGLAALIILIVIWTASLGAGSLESLASTVGIHVAGFFFFGLMAMALGNLQGIRRKMVREEMAPLSNRRWTAIMLGVVGGIVLLGMGIASIFSPGFVAAVTRLIGSVFHFLGQVVHYLFIPIAYLINWLVYAMMFIINLIRGKEPPEPFKIPEFLEPEELIESPVYQTVGVDVAMILKWIFFAFVIIVVVFLFIKAISRFRIVQSDVEVDEVSESLWSWLGFLADIRLFFSTLFRSWHWKRVKPMPVSTVPSWYLADDIQGTLSVREIYRYLLYEASIFGIRRRRFETPYEYTTRLGRAVPDSGAQLGELTDLYIDVRYGDHEAGNEKVEHANSLWRGLRRLLRRQEGPSG
jgi:hypothetical protein